MRQTEAEKKAKALRMAVANLGKPTSSKPTLATRYAAIAQPTPQNYVTDVDLMRLKREILEEMTSEDSSEVSEEFVKKIIQIMKKMPESDRLEVQDIRNHQAFMYKGTKYGMHEMMHGGSVQSSTSTTFVDNEVVAGNGTAWTLASTPTAGSVSLYGKGQFLTAGGVDYTIVGTAITTINSFTTGDIIAFYRYTS